MGEMAGGIEHVLPLTAAVNSLIGQPVAQILDALGLPYPSETPIPNHLVVATLIVGGLLLFAAFVRMGLREVPVRNSQHIAEIFLEVVHNLVEEIIGHKGRRYQTLIGTLALFILIGNLIGLFPFFGSPTASPNTTFALSISVFFYYHWQGIREQGVLRYLRHFAGPELPRWLIPLNVLFFFIEILSHCSRVVSLAIRLFGNIFGEDVVLVILFSLLPYLVPIPMMGLAIFTSLLQTFVFIMLTMMYLAGAVATEDHH
jgi:F-type H+-transporting ATPase subunit a